MSQALSAAIRKLLRPVIRILLRNHVSFGVFSDLAKRVYVEVAMEEFGLPGRKQSVSRVSILTGLSRKEVGRVRHLPIPDDAEAVGRYNRAARVVTGWVRDEAFSDGQGNPAVLSVEGTGATFAELVRRFSGDVPARAVLDELLRNGLVGRRGEGKVRLLARAYVPRREETEKLSILGTDVSDLVRTIDHNLRAGETEALFQRKVAYDNLPEEVLPQLRERTRERAQALLEEMDRWLSQHDRDLNPSAQGTGRKRGGIGIYYFEEEFPEGGRGK
ncbi:MAG: DUF6502 family protein [Nitrospirota bacterium]